MKTKKIILPESQMPTQWYIIGKTKCDGFQNQL